MQIRLVPCLAGGALAALTLLSAAAQESSPLTLANPLAPLSFEPVWNASVTTVYDTDGHAHFGGAKLANSDAFNLNLNVGTRVWLPWQEGLFVPLGLRSENAYLGQVAGAPVDSSIHTLRLSTGLGYNYHETWTFTALISPELYRFDHVGSDTIGLSGGLLATHRVSTNFSYVFGVFIAPDNDVPAFPVLGLRWRVNEEYLLELGLPRTRFTGRLNSDLAWYVGADLGGMTYRTSASLGNRLGQSQYNNALATDRDVRVGAGFSFQLLANLRAELDGGYSVYRELDFHRIGTDVRFGPAPYVRAALGIRF